MPDSSTLTVRIPGIDREFKIDEWIHGRLYSRVRFGVGQSTSVQAYSYIMGQTVPTGGSAATERDTNMVEAGKLADGWQALIFSHQVEVEGDVASGGVAVQPALADIREIQNKCLQVFKIGRSPIYETSVGKLASGSGIVFQGTANNVSQVSNGPPDPRAQAAFLIPLHLREGKPFTVESRFPQTLSLSAVSYLMEWLEGLIQRPIDAA